MSTDFHEIHRITVASRAIAYRKTGNGPHLVLLHGGFQTSRCWRRVATTLASQFTLIAPDLPGLGSSDSLPSLAMLDVAEHLQVFLDALSVPPCHIAGHDLGGAIAVMLALRHPARITRLAFLDMLLPGFGFEEAWIPRPEGRFLWFGSLNSVPGVIETLLPGREKEYIELVHRTTSFDLNSFDPGDIASYGEAYRGSERLANLGAYFRAMWTNADAFRALHQDQRWLTIPTLAAGGEFSTGQAAGKSLEAFAPHGVGVVMPSCGHWLPEEQATATAQLLSQFFSEE